MTAQGDRVPPLLNEPAPQPMPGSAPRREDGPASGLEHRPAPLLTDDPGAPVQTADAVPSPSGAESERLRRRRGWVYLAWGLVLLALLAVLLVGLAAITVAGEAVPSHDVVEARFTTISLSPHSPSVRGSYEMWFDSRQQRVRLAFGAPGQGIQTVYYWRDNKGSWYVYGRRAVQGSPGYLPLMRRQQPALLTEDGVRRAFALLHRRADPATVSRVALRGRVVTAFVTASVTWPFRADAPTRVWLDEVTGLPLQFRSSVSNGPETGSAITTVLTSVDSLHTVPTTTLPSGFMQPPNTNPSPWEHLLQFMRGLMQRSA